MRYNYDFVRLRDSSVTSGLLKIANSAGWLAAATLVRITGILR